MKSINTILYLVKYFRYRHVEFLKYWSIYILFLDFFFYNIFCVLFIVNKLNVKPGLIINFQLNLTILISIFA